VDSTGVGRTNGFGVPPRPTDEAGEGVGGVGEAGGVGGVGGVGDGCGVILFSGPCPLGAKLLLSISILYYIFVSFIRFFQ